MEYHKDRFEDFSLFVFKGDQLKAIIPGNTFDETFYSHQGLSYGGIIVDKTLKFDESIQVFKSVLKFLNQENVTCAQIKLVPNIYNSFPSDEWLYLMFLTEAALQQRIILSVIDNRLPLIKLSTVRKRGIKKAATNGLVIKEESKFKGFWNTVLTPNLEQRFNAKPVHSLNEIEILYSRFPNNIRQFNVYKENVIVAGTTIFETDNVAHAQYISATTNRQELGSLDFLFNHLILNVFKDKKYLDFGSSIENSGKNINEGLLYWKESFGARAVSQDTYAIKTKNYKLLNTVML